MFRKSDLKLILITSIFLAIAFICFEAKAESSCDQNPVYCTLAKNRPDMDRLTLQRIATLFNQFAHKYGQDPVISVAIGMQETGLKQINRKKNIIVFNPNGITWKVERGVTDVCMFQFHVDTIVDQGIDPIMLKNDVAYCVEQHFRLMKIKRGMCSNLGDDSWTCYHSKTPKYREVYKKLVARYI